jgi:hypothetical protein
MIGGLFEKQSAVEAAGALISPIALAQPSDPGPCFKRSLPMQRRLVFEQQAKPFGVIEAARLGLVCIFLEAVGQAAKAKTVQLIERGMGEHNLAPQ